MQTEPSPQFSRPVVAGMANQTPSTGAGGEPLGSHSRSSAACDGDMTGLRHLCGGRAGRWRQQEHSLCPQVEAGTVH